MSFRGTAASLVSVAIGVIALACAAHAAPTGQVGQGQAGASNADSAAPGGNGSAAGVATKQGLAASPADKPGTIAVAPGIALTLTYTGEAAGNPTGGLKQGATFAGQVFGGLDFDLKTLAGIEGGAVHFAMVERHGRSDSADFIGNDTSVQEIYGQQKARLTVFTYEQMLAGGRIDIQVGRSGGNDTFLTSPLYCFFQSNAICGSPVYIFQVSNFTAFPASGYAGTAKVFLSPTVFVLGGAYAADPRNVAPGEVGYNFGVKTATGATLPLEIAYGTDFSTDRLPRHYGIGVIYDASRRADPYLDAAGQPAAVSGLPYRMEFGRSDVYAHFDQMLTRPDAESPRGLTVFGVALFHATGRVEQDHSLELGLVQVGTLPGRDLDTIGLAVNEKRFSSLFVDNIAAARVMAGGNADIPREELMLELNYGLQVDKAIRLTPNLQYVVNPDQASVPSRTRNIPDAFVVGGKVTIDMSALQAR